MDVPENLKNLSEHDWAVGAFCIISLIGGTVLTEKKFSDEKIEEMLAKLVATAPSDIAFEGMAVLLGQQA
jgi:hypothetical protein